MKEQTEEQVFLKNRYDALEYIAREVGFDDDAFAHTEFSLMPFFELIVEECAKIAEMQARSYTGENAEGRGCHDSAEAIRSFGKNFGNGRYQV